MSALETLLADVAKIARMVEPLVAFVAVAQKAVGVGGGAATEALAVIDAALRSLEQVASGQVTADEAQRQLAALSGTLDGNNAAADAGLAARFPPGGTP